MADATPMSEPATLLIDANAYGMASVYNFDTLKSNDGRPTGVIHGVLLSLFSLLREHPSALPVVLWDGRAQWRYDLYPEYKSGRDARPDQVAMRALYRAQTGPLRDMLLHLGIPQIVAVEEEADDVAGHLVRHLSGHGGVLMCTKDTDWIQAIDENVSWYSHPNKVKRLVTVENLPHYKEDYGFANGHAYIEACALAGDDSDKIRGIDGVGEKTAAKFLAEFGSAEAFWAAVDAGTHAPKGVVRERLASAAARELYARNMRLMDWRFSPPLHDSTFLWAAPFDRARAHHELYDLDLRMTADQLSKWTPAFDYRQAIGAHQHPLLDALHQAAIADEQATLVRPGP
jgi:5'-3' exonuclease